MAAPSKTASGGKYGGFPYDEVVFKYEFERITDTWLDTLLTSGVMKADAQIASIISKGSNKFSARYYKHLDATQDMQIYNGEDNIEFDEVEGGEYFWAVYGRMKGWKARQFVDDFTGSDQMGYIVSQIAKYRSKQRQALLIKMLEGLFKIQTPEGWKLHTTDISTTTGANETNELGAGTIYEAITKACGDNADGFKVVIMHSAVAAKLNVLKLLEFDKYTDNSGITTDLRTATFNGMRVIINDNVPVENGASNKYTTYVLGEGAFGYASAPVSHPLEYDRDPVTNGGIDKIMFRMRECIVPYGFSWKGDVLTDVGIPDTELVKSSNYELFEDPKSIKLVKIVSN